MNPEDLYQSALAAGALSGSGEWDLDAVMAWMSKFIQRVEPTRRVDAADTALFAQSLREIESRVYAKKYPGFKARQLIPLKQDIDKATDTLAYRVWDQYGMAKVVANYADDLPMVDVAATEETAKIKTLGDAYQFTIIDMWRAARTGVPIDTERASAARRAIEAAIDEIAAVGLGPAGLGGFANNPNVPIIAPDFGDWNNSARTAEEIEADILKLVGSIPDATESVHQANTVVMDSVSYRLIASKKTDEGLGRTVLQSFLATNPGFTIEPWHRLNTADAEGDGPRMVAYAKDPEVLELLVPLDFLQLDPEPRNLAMVVNCLARTGGTLIRFPLAMAYMDGIG